MHSDGAGITVRETKVSSLSKTCCKQKKVTKRWFTSGGLNLVVVFKPTRGTKGRGAKYKHWHVGGEGGFAPSKTIRGEESERKKKYPMSTFVKKRGENGREIKHHPKLFRYGGKIK